MMRFLVGMIFALLALAAFSAANHAKPILEKHLAVDHSAQLYDLCPLDPPTDKEAMHNA